MCEKFKSSTLRNIHHHTGVLFFSIWQLQLQCPFCIPQSVWSSFTEAIMCLSISLCFETIKCVSYRIQLLTFRSPFCIFIALNPTWQGPCILFSHSSCSFISQYSGLQRKLCLLAVTFMMLPLDLVFSLKSKYTKFKNLNNPSTLIRNSLFNLRFPQQKNSISFKMLIMVSIFKVPLGSCSPSTFPNH